MSSRPETASPGSSGTTADAMGSGRRLAIVAAGLIALDLARVFLLPGRYQTAFTDGFEAVVATLCAVACAAAARRSSRSATAQWALVAAFFVLLAAADAHDLAFDVLGPGAASWPRLLELFGWLTYLPLGFLVVFPVEERDREPPWVSLLDFAQVALVLGLLNFHFIYSSHLQAQQPWTVRGPAEDVRNAALALGLLLRAWLDPSRQSRALYGRVGATFAVVTVLQGLFAGRLDVVHVLGRPAALLGLGLLAASWRAAPDAPRAHGGRRIASGWILGLVPAAGPMIVLALEACPSALGRTITLVTLATSIAIFVARPGLAEYQRQLAVRLQELLYGIASSALSARDLRALYAAVQRLVAQVLPDSDFCVTIRDRQTGAVDVPLSTRCASTGDPEDDARALVDAVLRTGHLVARAERLGVPLQSGQSTFGVLAVRRRTAGARYGHLDRVLLTFVAQHLSSAIERRQAEQAVHASEERLRQAVQASQVGVFDHDHVSDTIYWSAEIRQIFGWTAEETVSLQEFVERVHPDDRPALAAAVRRAHDPSGDGVYQAEFRIVRRDGGARWAAARSQTSFEGDGPERRPRRTVGAVVELTERKRTEEELRESARVLLESQRVARLGSFRTDLVAGTWTCSAILDDIFGIADPTFRKDVNAWLSVVHPDEREQLASYLAEEVLEQRRTFDREYRIRRLNDGQDRWVHGIGKLVVDAAGRPVEMIGTIQDITERKRAEAERTNIEAMLLQSQKMEAIGRLAGGVAHDFNNLLSVIRGHGERLLADPGDVSAQRGRLEQILWAADKAGSLTRQLLAFTRQQVLAPRVVRLDSIVADARRLLERLIGEDVELVVSVPEGLGCVRADASQLVQVLLNLAVNARDAMPNGGRLTVESEEVDLDDAFVAAHATSRPGRFVRLSVSDTGVGMDPETTRRVFEPFFTTKPPGAGTGLGLSTVYGIVEQSGGFVLADSRLGEGSTFSVFLPRVEEDGPPAAGDEPPARRAQSAGSGRRILLVEDDDGVRELMLDVLETAGYEVVASAHPARAFELASSLAFDLLVTDVIMPGMSGGELARRLQDSRPGLRVLFVSGYGGEALARTGRIREGEYFLQKPFSQRDLLENVAAALAGEPDPGETDQQGC